MTISNQLISQVGEHSSQTTHRRQVKAVVTANVNSPSPPSDWPRQPIVKPQAPPSNTPDDVEQQAIYDKPLPPKLALLKSIIESWLGHEIDLDFSQFNFDAGGGELSPLPSDELQHLAERVEVEGQQFHPEQWLQVSEITIKQQRMTYQLAAEFDWQGRTMSGTLALDFQHKLIEVSESLQTAQQLKDPLIIQYGSQAIRADSVRVDFDFNADGELETLPIFAGDVGYLVYDRNGNGRVDNGLELFGPRSNNGFDELAELDDNGDGFITAEDASFDKLFVWTQVHGQQQLTSLQQLDIAGLYTGSVSTPFTLFNVNGEAEGAIRQTSFSFNANGSFRPVHQVDVRV